MTMYLMADEDMPVEVLLPGRLFGYDPSREVGSNRFLHGAIYTTRRGKHSRVFLVYLVKSYVSSAQRLLYTRTLDRQVTFFNGA